MGTYIAFGIIVLILLFFLAWAWGEPAGGIIAIIAGVIFYLSGPVQPALLRELLESFVIFMPKKQRKKHIKQQAEIIFFLSWRNC